MKREAQRAKHTWRRFLNWPPTQLQRVREFMLGLDPAGWPRGVAPRDGKLRRGDARARHGAWHTLREIARATGDAEPSVSAQLRHLRNARFGGYRVMKRRRRPAASRRGPVWEYRVVPRTSTSDARNRKPETTNRNPSHAIPIVECELPISGARDPVSTLVQPRIASHESQITHREAHHAEAHP